MEGHNRKMRILGFKLDNESATCDTQQTNSQYACRSAIGHSIVRRRKYTNTLCRPRNYPKLKGILQHIQHCNQEENGGCPICNNLDAVWCYHVKRCQKDKCPIHFCMNFANKVKHQQLQQAENSKSHIPTMQYCQVSVEPPQLMGGPGSISNSIVVSSMGPPPQIIPNAGPSLGGMQIPTRVIGQLLQTSKLPPRIIPNAGPSLGGIQIPTRVIGPLLQTSKSPPSAQQDLATIEPNPIFMSSLTAATVEPQQQQEQQLQQLQQRLQQIRISKQCIATMQNSGMSGQPTQVMGEIGNMPNCIGNSAMGPPPQVMPNPGPSLGGMHRPIQTL